jgi:hypothetical protein
MSKISLSPNASGTGTFTIAAPNSSTDRTLTLPDSTGTIATAESTLAQFSASGSAPVYACRAWVNFNGTGTVAIRASGNVSSITDNGTGNYTVNFTTAMPDANYATTGTSRSSGISNGMTLGTVSTATTNVVVSTTSGSANASLDTPEVCVAIFR